MGGFGSECGVGTKFVPSGIEWLGGWWRSKKLWIDMSWVGVVMGQNHVFETFMVGLRGCWAGKNYIVANFHRW